MFPQVGIHGPVAPGHSGPYDPMQVSGPVAGFAPAQVSGPGAYYPTQTDPTTSMMNMIMPLMMMIMMMGMMMPMMKGITGKA